MKSKIIYCSICKQEFDEDDELIKVRKERHEAKHAPRHTLDGKPIKVNTIIGKVAWLRK